MSDVKNRIGIIHRLLHSAWWTPSCYHHTLRFLDVSELIIMQSIQSNVKFAARSIRQNM